MAVDPGGRARAGRRSPVGRLQAGQRGACVGRGRGRGQQRPNLYGCLPLGAKAQSVYGAQR
ncbi:MAG TPA: hypothetical protein VF897_08410, partial [Roseiflexaceae bacterium]